jgi:hypothetical protein
MPENEFEKKVSSELQELKFKPSETVWMKVEERIREKKRKRTFIILFLLGGLALLGYWQRDNIFGEKKNDLVKTETPLQEKNNKVNDNTQKTPEETRTTTEPQKPIPGISDKNAIEEKEESIAHSSKETDHKITDSKVLPKTTINNKDFAENKKLNETKEKQTEIKPAPKKKIIGTKDDLSISTTNDPVPVKDSFKAILIQSGDVKQNEEQITKPIENKIDSIKLETVAKKEEIKKDSLAKKTDSLSKVVSVDSPVVNFPKRSFDKKWNLGIEFDPGISSFSESFFSFSMNKSAADYSASPGSGSSNPPASPSRRQPGFAFQIGGFAKKQFAKRSGVSLGLRYAFYSDNIKIGQRRANFNNALYQFLDAQGANQAYGAAGDTLHFTNSYHFIELPINYTLRLNKKESNPISLQIGLKLGRMIGSHALVYDTVGGGIYYRSDRYFNKTQFGFSASLNWTVINKQKFQWTLGPVFDIHFNSLLKSPFEDRNYLFFTGLRTSMKFNSKK